MVDNNFENEKRSQISLMKSIADYGMGGVIFVIGCFFLLRRFLNIPLNKSYPPDFVDVMVGVLFVVYGAWRIRRGYKKKYFR